jgi:RNA polymerase sigma-70 factor (ECF subfamily)
MSNQPTPTTPMELMLSGEYPWLRWKCSYIAYSVGISKGVKINPDDLFVDTVAKAVRLQHNYTDLGISLKPWLGTIAANLAITMGNKLRKKSMNEQDTNVKTQDGEDLDFMDNMEKPEVGGASVLDDLISNINIKLIDDAIASITPTYAEVIRLNMIEGLTYAEISAKLDIPQNTVSSRVSRGREELTPLLKEMASEFGITGKKKEK